MKTIGLIGGMSWESSTIYYELINKKVNELLGGFHSAKCILVSVDFAEIENLLRKNEWESITKLMAASVKQLENAGADLILLCTNTIHLCSAEMIKGSSTPFLHIAKATGQAIQSKGLKRLALLGTSFTMEKDFYKNVLSTYNIQVIIPNDKDREIIDQIIFKELVQGDINNKSRQEYIRIIKDLEHKGAEGVILGCTEIPLLIQQKDVDIPIFNTTKIHAETAVEMVLNAIFP